MALTDSDVQKQIKQMMGFIEQEANEKVEEIDAKAEEEFNIEKGRLVQQQRLKIMEFYERKEKQVELQKKIQSSNLLNQARLKVLQAQQQHIQNLLAESRTRLGKSSGDRSNYTRVICDLIIQALFQIMEPVVTIRCREVDLELVESVLPEAIAKYSEAMHKPCQINIAKENFLPVNTCGGVELAAFHGRIRVNNTLENRLEMIAELESAPTLPPRGHLRTSQTAQTEPSSPIPSSIELGLNEAEWYWGSVTREKIDDLMKDTPDGTFLIRDASSKAGEYTLTLRKGGCNKLVKICRNRQGRYGFSEPYRFNSILELVQFYRSASLGQYNPALNVTLLYPVSRFLHAEESEAGNGDDLEKMRRRLESAHLEYLTRSRQYNQYHDDYCRCSEEIQFKKQASDAFDVAVLMFDEQLLLHDKFQREAHRHEVYSLEENYQLLKSQMSNLVQSRHELQENLRVQAVLSRNLDREMNALKPELHQLCKTRDLLQTKFLSTVLVYIQQHPSSVHADSQHWFLPDCTRPAAESLLIGKEDGTFLIRRSAGAPFALTIACRNVEKGVGHILIYRSERGFGFTEPYLLFPTLNDLVVYYAGHSLEELNPKMNTKLAYPLQCILRSIQLIKQVDNFVTDASQFFSDSRNLISNSTLIMFDEIFNWFVSFTIQKDSKF
uniref:EOG090X0F8Y n=1 Tax=Daphnia hispanica TaxID=575233 RepID=A0A4Y7M2V9_9CRUS|nr:EOG090X0F8Y [Daphnia hispanica]